MGCAWNYGFGLSFSNLLGDLLHLMYIPTYYYYCTAEVLDMILNIGFGSSFGYLSDISYVFAFN